jgi:hypothetical protein
MVVSSDHRIQRAARRRKASFLDSDIWFADAMRARARRRSVAAPPAKPQPALSGDDVSYWVAEFAEGVPTEEPTNAEPESDPKSKPKRKKSKPRKDDVSIDDSNPFPPGYGEDLLES